MTLSAYIEQVDRDLGDRLDLAELRDAVHAWWAPATAQERGEALVLAEQAVAGGLRTSERAG